MVSIKPNSLKVRFLVAVSAVTLMTLSIASYEALPATATSRQVQEDREYEIYQPNWPVGALELVEVKNLQSESFPQDFEIEVKNIGTKPIYGIYFGLGVRGLGTDMYYGDGKLGAVSALASPTDIPIKVGETGILKLSANAAKGFQAGIEKLPFADTHKILIIPQVVNFGDGTGYICNSPYPAKRENKH
ncbi:MAG: hypothetical protein JST85_11290 [Acidobacteria bacterium]|nr:hypothetical protein [Acidobacteriota bacterium]